MRKILVVIDMQNDFIDGSLGTKEAQQIVPRVVEKMKEYDPWNIYLTRDTHYENYLDTQEGRNLPVEHCIEGTPRLAAQRCGRQGCGEGDRYRPSPPSAPTGSPVF